MSRAFKIYIMPNHIKNKVELIGSEIEIKEFVEKYSTFYPEKQHTDYDGNLTFKNGGEYGWLDQNTTVFTRRGKDSILGVPDGFEPEMVESWTRFPDFEKVFPVPEVIKAVGDSVNSSIINAVYAKYKKTFSENPLLAGLEALNRQKINIKPEEEMQFELACKAYEETGFAYWYDYQNEKWDTKWNAYSCEKLSDNIFIFETAWSGVPDIIKELSIGFNGTIIYKYADEDTGYNTGEYKIAHGIVLYENIPVGGSVEAYDLAFELRPDYKDNYILIDGNYVHKEE